MKFIIQVLTEENKQVGKVELKALCKRSARLEMAHWLHDKLMQGEIGVGCTWHNDESIEEFLWGEYPQSVSWYIESGWYDDRNNYLVLSSSDMVEGCDEVVIDYRKYILVEIATPEQIG
jgi:hypothetical protein